MHISLTPKTNYSPALSFFKEQVAHDQVLFIPKCIYEQIAKLGYASDQIFQLVCKLVYTYSLHSKPPISISEVDIGKLEHTDYVCNQSLLGCTGYSIPLSLRISYTEEHLPQTIKLGRSWVKDYLTLSEDECDYSTNGKNLKSDKSLFYDILYIGGNINYILVVVDKGFLSYIVNHKNNLSNFILDLIDARFNCSEQTDTLYCSYVSLNTASDASFNTIVTKVNSFIV